MPLSHSLNLTLCAVLSGLPSFSIPKFNSSLLSPSMDIVPVDAADIDVDGAQTPL